MAILFSRPCSCYAVRNSCQLVLRRDVCDSLVSFRHLTPRVYDFAERTKTWYCHSTFSSFDFPRGRTCWVSKKEMIYCLAGAHSPCCDTNLRMLSPLSRCQTSRMSHCPLRWECGYFSANLRHFQNSRIRHQPAESPLPKLRASLQPTDSAEPLENLRSPKENILKG